ncbi:putative Histidine kinase [Magnetospirillum sp. LM-5]|uniref:PAS domain S-box protein n=1 Tax=Magnetospirillum sp. LM-5 TaxID=2681466 RepID=UPI0013819D96|nr:PAS domain S-box protein [Magnetospirillum sp. LM-5]CAA7615603.1 putative Histidine kinase [Magnetospirillum sp. LM-5]
MTFVSVSSSKRSVAAALVVMLGLLAASALRIHEVYDSAVENEVQRLTQAAQSAETRVAESDQAVQRLLESVAQGNAAGDSAWLRTLVHPFKEVRQAFLVGPDGRVVASSLPDLLGRDVSHRPYYTQLLEQGGTRRFFMTPPLRTMDGGPDVIFVSMRIDRPDGSWGGVAVAALDLEFYNAVAERIVLPGGGSSAALVSRTGIIIARHPDPVSFFGKNIADGKAFVGHVESGKVQSVHRTQAATDGRDKLIVARTYMAGGTTPVLIFLTRDMDDVLEPWRRGTVIELAVLVVTCIGVGVLGWLAARRESRLRQARAAIEENARLVLAMEQSPASVVITDLEGRIEFVNPAFTRVTGYDITEARGENPRILKSGHTPDDEYRAMWAALRAGDPWSTVFLNKRKDGSTYWEQAQISPIRDARGQMTGYIAVKENITDRMIAEQTIRRLNQRLQSLLDAATQVAIIATDPDGLITTFNRGAELMLGYCADEMVGRSTPLAFHDPAEVDARSSPGNGGFRTFVHRADREGHDCGEWTCIRKDGTRFPVSLMVSPVRGDDGDIVGYLGLAIDISNELRMKAELIEGNQRLDRQARELARANEELAEFAYAASHDLRQPLRMVSAYLTLIARKLSDQLDPESQTYFGFAIDGAKRMDALILGLLDYSRVGRAGGAFEPVSLRTVLETQIRTLAFTLEEVGGQIEVAPDLPTIQGDEPELNRLVGNILGNAIKYRAPDRPLRVSVGWNIADRETILWIKDNGRGMDPKDHERAFRVFQRLVPQGEVEGTGIGLAICRKIAQHHGGRMWISSSIQDGCTFHVAFPAEAGTGERA